MPQPTTSDTGSSQPSPSGRLSGSSRLEAFSDGVFAIAITLLVLDLRVPEGKSAEGHFFEVLAAAWESYLAYLASFLIIGAVWLTHHAMFSRIQRTDNTLVQRNLLELLLTSLLPFPVAVVSSSFREGTGDDQRVAVVFFAAVSLALSLSWYWTCGHIQKSAFLLTDPADITWVRADRRLQLLGAAPSAIAVPVALFSPIASLAILAATPVLYLLSLKRSQ